jgi:hypothetical protein
MKLPHVTTHARTNTRTYVHPHTHTPHKWCAHTPTPTHNSPLVQQWVVPSVRVVLRVKLLRCVRLQHHTRNMSSSLGQILSARDGMMLAERQQVHGAHTLCGGGCTQDTRPPATQCNQGLGRLRLPWLLLVTAVLATMVLAVCPHRSWLPSNCARCACVSTVCPFDPVFAVVTTDT